MFRDKTEGDKGWKRGKAKKMCNISAFLTKRAE